MASIDHKKAHGRQGSPAKGGLSRAWRAASPHCLSFLRLSLLILREKQTAQLCLPELQQPRLNCYLQSVRERTGLAFEITNLIPTQGRICFHHLMSARKPSKLIQYVLSSDYKNQSCSLRALRPLSGFISYSVDLRTRPSGLPGTFTYPQSTSSNKVLAKCWQCWPLQLTKFGSRKKCTLLRCWW